MIPSTLVFKNYRLNIPFHYWRKIKCFNSDFNQLKYSIRSIEMYAPWIRNIYIVTNGQKPSWAKLDHPNVFVVSHKEIFQQETDLPTFNSMAIEVHLHQIEGLRKMLQNYRVCLVICLVESLRMVPKLFNLIDKNLSY